MDGISMMPIGRRGRAELLVDVRPPRPVPHRRGPRGHTTRPGVPQYRVASGLETTPSPAAVPSTPSRWVGRWPSESSTTGSVCPAVRPFRLTIRSASSPWCWSCSAAGVERVSPSAPERPRFAYLLLTHKGPRHVESLARRIQDLSPARADRRAPRRAAAGLPWGGSPPRGVHLVEPGRVAWGDWSMIEASLRMIRFAMDRLEADWFVLLSGEHRPAVDLRQWEASTVASGIDALLGAERLPDHLHFGTADFDQNQHLARSRHRWRLFARPRAEVGHRSVGVLAKLSARTRPLVSVEYIHRREAWADRIAPELATRSEDGPSTVARSGSR